MKVEYDFNCSCYVENIITEVPDNATDEEIRQFLIDEIMDIYCNLSWREYKEKTDIEKFFEHNKINIHKRKQWKVIRSFENKKEELISLIGEKNYNSWISNLKASYTNVEEKLSLEDLFAVDEFEDANKLNAGLTIWGLKA